MTSQSDGRNGDQQLPETELSVNQIVAANLRAFRTAAGLSQRELGDKIGRSHANISNLERSVEPGQQRREFDADLITALALAIGVPVGAFFLPPVDDGITTRYVAVAADELTADMRTMFDIATAEPADDQTPAAQAYIGRLRHGITVYASPVPGGDLGQYFEDLSTEEKRAAALERIRWQLSAIRAVAADLDRLETSLTESSDDD